MFVSTRHEVRDVEAGPDGYDAGRLSLDLDRLGRLAADDPRIAAVRLELVRPGDRTRVLSVLDLFDARHTEDGPTYPGFDGPPVTAGRGRTHVLDGFQIVASATLPAGEGGLMVTQPAFLDFWGAGAGWTPFSRALTLVADIEIDPELEDKAAADDAITRAMVRLSTAIGRLAADAPGEDREWPGVKERADSGLPRVAYVYQVQSQKAPLETFLYGAHVDALFPTLLDPVEVLDGALVSGNRGLQTVPTISHCNNPVLLRLLEEDGRKIHLLPVVLMEGHQKTAVLKQRSAAHAVQLLRFLGADAAVFTQEGGGMSVVDQMLTIEGAEASGIRCVAITYEMAGAEGTDTPLIYFSRAARHLISTGNREEPVELEAPERTIGPGVRGTLYGDLSQAVTGPVRLLYGSTSQVGSTFVQAYPA